MAWTDSLGLATYKRSVATMSWIDPRTLLLEVDTLGEPRRKVRRQDILAGLLYRFANFLEVFVGVIPTKGQIWIGDYGFTRASGLYTGVSFAGLPPIQFQVKRYVQESDETHITFRQVVGARTQSPEKLAGLLGKVPEAATELLISFPPIWTDLRLTVFRDGYYEAEVVNHSLFPSMTFYEGHILALDSPGDVHARIRRRAVSVRRNAEGQLTHEAGSLAMPVKVVTDGFYRRISTYDGVPNYDKWHRQGWGELKDRDKKGPIKGNPWGAARGDWGVSQ
jgi:hypothetical protein